MRVLRTAARLAFIPIGLVLGLLLLELGLQTVAWYVEVTGRELPVTWVTEHQRILCVGDSNTYGLYLDRAEAYPRQVQDLWNENVGSPEIEVLNLGFPGTNSSRLLSNLSGMLRTFNPETVIVLVGANDFWTAPVPFDPSQDTRGGAMRFLARRSRAFKLFDMVRRARDTAKLEVTIDPKASQDSATGTARYGDREFSLGWVRHSGEWEANPFVSLAQNLRTIVRQTQDFGVKIILMTYASTWQPYGAANTLIKAAAAETNTPLVDLASAFEAVCGPCRTPGSAPQVCEKRQPCPEYLFEDHHPTAAGYRLVAKAVVGRLAD